MIRKQIKGDEGGNREIELKVMTERDKDSLGYEDCKNYAEKWQDLRCILKIDFKIVLKNLKVLINVLNVGRS